MGHVAGDLVRNTLQAVIIIFMGLLVGFHPSASVPDWAVIVVLVFLFTLAVSWMAAIMGLAAKTLESVSWIGFLVMFPLTFASAAFVPTKTMPPVLRTFAENQPVTHIVEAIRALTLGKSAGQHLWFALVWCMAIIIISIPVAAYLFRRHGGK
jgi:ABC-2 type transport system permease protein